ncbi:hypothetical protein [Paenibacillus ottowii]|nr:hypothetical protein [Paenibacillus sp. CMAA1739]
MASFIVKEVFFQYDDILYRLNVMNCDVNINIIKYTGGVTE